MHPPVNLLFDKEGMGSEVVLVAVLQDKIAAGMQEIV